MNTSLSSLPPPSFGDVALRGDSRPSYAPSEAAAADAAAAQLHASTTAGVRAIDDIERDFLAALCESRPD